MAAKRKSKKNGDGEGFLYLGRTYRLQLVKKQDRPLLLKNGYFLLRMDVTRKSKVNPDEVFKEFYREKGLKKSQERVLYYRTKMGVMPKSVRVIELRNRWASCSAKSVLNFHWKCMMAPLKILDYFVVHELAHLTHARHTEAFWNEVDKVMPDFEERKGWLRQHGAGMGL